MQFELGDALLAAPAISVGQQAVLEGALEISLAASYTPAEGDRFDLIAAEGGFAGALGDVSLPTLAPGLGWDLHLQGDRLVLEVVANFVPGDFNRDGHVDAVDYTVWRDGLGTAYTMEDYADWKSNFGYSSGGSAAVGHHDAVPEPVSTFTCGMLLAAASICGCRCVIARSQPAGFGRL
jgi:hypothetical protein